MTAALAAPLVRRWTPAEDDRVRLAYREEGWLADLAVALGRTRTALIGRAYRLGLRKPAAGGRKPRPGREPSTPFRPKMLIEFWSPARGGCWKPGTVEAVLHDHEKDRKPAVRIRVGPGVWVVRKAANCRVPQGD